MNDNRLIAEFMGYVYEDDILVPEEPQYHTSWDWLMPVVVKCFAIHDDEVFMYDKWTEKADNLNYILNNALLEINIQSLYQAVVEFIKTYNDDNNK